MCLVGFCGVPGSFVQSQIWLFFIRFIAFHHEPNSLCALMGRCSSVLPVRKSYCCQICGLLRSQRTAPRGTSEKLVQIPASEIEPCLGGEIVSQHNMSNQRQSDTLFWWKEETRRQVRCKQRKATCRDRVAWVLLGCMCSECDSWVTLWQVLKTYESEEGFFCCLSPTRPTALHTSSTWQRFTVLEQMAQHAAAHVKWTYHWMNMSTTRHNL